MRNVSFYSTINRKIMKKALLFILSLGLWLPLSANKNSQVANELVWFGIDYSLVKFIGTPDQFTDIPKIQNYYFRAWNDLILAEENKYDLKTAFSVSTIHYDMENSCVRSEKRSMEGIVQAGPYTIDEEQVRAVVQSNVIPEENIVGAMFVMETLNKLEGLSTMWLAVFNVGSGEILYTRRYSGAVGGFGFRNYYARSYYNVIKNLKMSPRGPQ